MSYTSQPDSIEVRYENGLIVFDDYEAFKIRAQEARDYLMQLDVSPESEQECKRTVAAARKITDQLNQKKISVKKAVLEPYNDFEAKVKEIMAIVTEGENVARDKLKAIDDQRREEKKAELRRIWDARCGSFISGAYLTFDRFLQDKHLNKTVPISEVEHEMVVFFMDKSDDIKYLSEKPRGEEYIEEYCRCMNALKAMEAVDRRHETIKATSSEPYMVIRITGKADVILAKQLLSDINYKVLEEK